MTILHINASSEKQTIHFEGRKREKKKEKKQKEKEI